GVPLKLRRGQRDRHCGLEDIAKQELGKRVAAGSGGTLSRIRLERKLATRKLVADLVEILPAVLETEAEAVLAAIPGEVVDKLQRVVVDRKRTILHVADRVKTVAGKRDQRYAPGERRAGLEIRNSQGGNCIYITGRVCTQ